MAKETEKQELSRLSQAVRWSAQCAVLPQVNSGNLWMLVAGLGGCPYMIIPLMGFILVIYRWRLGLSYIKHSCRGSPAMETELTAHTDNNCQQAPTSIKFQMSYYAILVYQSTRSCQRHKMPPTRLTNSFVSLVYRDHCTIKELHVLRVWSLGGPILRTLRVGRGGCCGSTVALKTANCW